MTNWKVYNMLKNPSNGFVVKLTYGCELEDNGLLVDRFVSELEFIQTSDDFVPFEDITKELALQWIESKVGNVAMAQVEQSLITKYNLFKEDNQSAPVSGLPW